MKDNIFRKPEINSPSRDKKDLHQMIILLTNKLNVY